MKADPSRDFEALFREHGDRIWRAVFAFSGDREVASDAVAEAFAQALRGGDRIRSPLAWIWRASFRIAAGELGERRTRGALVMDVEAQPTATTEEELVAALQRISPAQRAAVVLHHYAGYPAAEVADIIGSSAAAVRVHLMRGRRRLRELLKEEDE